MCVLKLIYVCKIHTYIPTHVYICNNIHPYMYIYIHTYINTYVQTYIHTCILPSIQTWIHPCIHTYILTYIHTYIHTYIYTYIHACIYRYIHITGVTRTFVYVEISVYVVMLHSAIFTQITRIIIYFDHFRFSKDKHVSMQMKPYIPSKEWYICFAFRKINEYATDKKLRGECLHLAIFHACHPYYNLF